MYGLHADATGMLIETDSATIGLEGSSEPWRVFGAGESSTISSSWSSSMVGVEIGVGVVTSICVQKGVLCGRGETSMSSVVGPGDDEGRGGVVTKSRTRSA